MNYKDFFKGKKITMMGLGILGRGVNVAKFLAECGAELTVTDLKAEDQLAPSLKKLSKFPKIKYVLGRHDMADFSGKDMVIKAAGAPLDSPYIAEARKNNIPIEMDASLFAKLTALSTSNVDIIGITGTRGKSTVTHLIYSIIKNSGRRVYLGGHLKGFATFPLLKKEKEKNIIKSRMIIADRKNIPKGWKIKLLGEHNLANVSLAAEAARKLGVKESMIKKSVEKFKGLPGRLEFIKEAKGVKFYNDTTATTPEAGIAALESLEEKKGRIILIGGGADKNLEYGEYAKIVKKSVKALALFRGLVSNKIISSLGKVKFPMEVFDNMKAAMKFAVANAKKGDIVLLSPGAASFGVFKNEFDRGEQFNKSVKNMKKFDSSLT